MCRPPAKVVHVVKGWTLIVPIGLALSNPGEMNRFLVGWGTAGLVFDHLGLPWVY